MGQGLHVLQTVNGMKIYCQKKESVDYVFCAVLVE